MPHVAVHGINLEYTYPGTKNRVLAGASVTLWTGRIHVLLGRNGSGKTTFVEILSGVRVPDSGKVEGRPSRVGLLQQTPVLDPDLTVKETLRLGAMIVRSSLDQEASILERLDLLPLLNKRVSQLSGGNRRRVDVALALLGRPSLLVLDEPTTGIDPATKEAFWKLLREEAPHCAILVTTQDLAEVGSHADHLLIIDEGTISEVSSNDLGSVWIVETADGGRSLLENDRVATVLDRLGISEVTSVRRRGVVDLDFSNESEPWR